MSNVRLQVQDKGPIPHRVAGFMVKNLQDPKSSHLAYIVHPMHRPKVPRHAEVRLATGLLRKVRHADDTLVLATDVGIVDVYRETSQTRHLVERCQRPRPAVVALTGDLLVSYPEKLNVLEALPPGSTNAYTEPPELTELPTRDVSSETCAWGRRILPS